MRAVPGFPIEAIARGIWLAQPACPVAYCCNAVVFEQDSGLGVVDTHSSPWLAEALIAQIGGEISPKPVHYVIYTHPHFDHILGTQAYRDRAGPDWFDSVAGFLRDTLREETDLLDPERQSPAALRWQRRRDDTEDYIGRMQGAAPVLPDVTFEGELNLYDSLQTLQLRSLGRAHSDSDLLVLSPSRKVVATGDFAYDGLPFTAVSFPEPWVKALRELEAASFDKFAGGHGPAGNKQCLTERRTYIEELTTLALRSKQDGESLDEFLDQIGPGALGSLQGSAGEKYSTEPRSLLAVPAAGANREQWFAAAVRANAAQIWSRLDAR